MSNLFVNLFFAWSVCTKKCTRVSPKVLIKERSIPSSKYCINLICGLHIKPSLRLSCLLSCGFAGLVQHNAPINVKPQGGGGGERGVTHGNLIPRTFPRERILTLSRPPGSGIWHVRHPGRPREPGNKSSTIIPTYLTINLVLKLSVFHLSRFLFYFSL